MQKLKISLGVKQKKLGRKMHYYVTFRFQYVKIHISVVYFPNSLADDLP